MRTPYGLKLSESCPTCKFRKDGFFCQLSPGELNDFDAIKSVATYRAGAVLFVEQQMPQGFFQVCEGEVKLSLSSRDGKAVILRIARPGDVLGMWALLFGAPYEATAESLRPCQIAFVSSGNFRQYLRRHPGVLQLPARYLGLHSKSACEQLSAIGSGAPVPERMARFLLDRSSERGTSQNESSFTLSLTHEDIAEYIGATRESVTRALSKFRNRGLIAKKGSTFLIPSRAALAEFSLHRTTPRATMSRLVCLTPAILQRHSRELRHSAWRVARKQKEESVKSQGAC